MRASWKKGVNVSRFPVTNFFGVPLQPPPQIAAHRFEPSDPLGAERLIMFENKFGLTFLQSGQVVWLSLCSPMLWVWTPMWTWELYPWARHSNLFLLTRCTNGYRYRLGWKQSCCAEVWQQPFLSNNKIKKYGPIASEREISTFRCADYVLTQFPLTLC